MKTSPAIANKGDHSIPTLQNPRHERFAQELATGKSADAAYVLAGYRTNRSNAARLSANQDIQRRVAEIQSMGAERAAITVETLIAEAEAARTKAMAEKELDKKLTGLLLGGLPLISIDNVRRQLDSDLLCRACERPLLELRRLGKSDIFTTPNSACIYSTGNNLLLSGEMIRRALLSTLDAGVERPERRTFRGNPIAAVQANRGLYIAAVLTITRSYLAAGRPAEQTPLGSYSAWCKLVREPLIWLGKADPVASQEVVRQTDPVLGTLLEVMQGWERVIGLFVPKTTLAVKTLMSNDLPRRSGETDDEWKQRQLCLAELRDALLKIAGDRNVIDTDRLGKWLRRYKGRIEASRRFVNVAPGSTAARWQLESLPMGNG